MSHALPIDHGDLNMEKPKLYWSHLAASPIFGVICLLAGGATAGSALRAESEARAFASVVPPSAYPRAAVNPMSAPRMAAESSVVPSRQIINLDPMVIVGQAPVAAPARLPAPCVAGWRELEQGPSGRHVLTTCGAGTADQAVTSRSAMHRGRGTPPRAEDSP